MLTREEEDEMDQDEEDKKDKDEENGKDEDEEEKKLHTTPNHGVVSARLR